MFGVWRHGQVKNEVSDKQAQQAVRSALEPPLMVVERTSVLRAYLTYT